MQVIAQIKRDGSPIGRRQQIQNLYSAGSSPARRIMKKKSLILVVTVEQFDVFILYLTPDQQNKAKLASDYIMNVDDYDEAKNNAWDEIYKLTEDQTPEQNNYLENFEGNVYTLQMPF